MDIHVRFVEFDQYCKTCQYEKLPENEPPCDECLEHPVNTDTIKPFCYKERNGK